MTTEETIDSVFSLWEAHGQDDYIGEPVSQLEHASQAAAITPQRGSAITKPINTPAPTSA